MKDYQEQLWQIREEMEKECLEKEKQKYPKKNFTELIDLLEEKGIGFNIVSKEDAYRSLHDSNYYYKLTVYKRNFRKGKDGRRQGLEFSYLKDLASVDMQLRYILLHMTLDIEHALKTFIITKITENDDIDGYDIVRRFFHSTVGKEKSKPLDREIILQSIKSEGHYQYNLYNAHKNALSAWVLVEVVGFGDFLRFFEFYFKKYSCEEFKINSFMGALNGVRSVRNACAHNTPFLFDLYAGMLKNVNCNLKKYAEDRGIGELFYKCKKVHDVLSVFYVHENFVLGSGSKTHRRDELKALIMDSKQKLKYLDTSNDIVHFLNIIEKVIDKYSV